MQDLMAPVDVAPFLSGLVLGAVVAGGGAAVAMSVVVGRMLVVISVWMVVRVVLIVVTRDVVGVAEATAGEITSPAHSWKY